MAKFLSFSSRLFIEKDHFHAQTALYSVQCTYSVQCKVVVQGVPMTVYTVNY